ncbi:type VI secretion system tip protein VgrG [bacterium]|nr:type VI secretion system tip protein VgrG [bacterium]
MAFEQEHRSCQLAPSSGLEGFLVRRMTGREAISEPFVYELEVMAPDPDVSLADLMGQSVTFFFDRGELDRRFVNGVVDWMRQETADVTGAVYRLRLVPWLALLKHRTDSRVFQEATVPEIIEQVLQDYKFAEIDPRLEAEYEQRLHCVQYQESDADFICRLLEEEGIAYHFEHEDGRHVMVLMDDPKRREACHEQPTVLFETATDTGEEAVEVVRELTPEHRLQSGSYLLGDFNFRDPGTTLQAPEKSRVQTPVNEPLEQFIYPGEFVKLGAEDAEKLPLGETRAAITAERDDVTVVQAHGESDCTGLAAGRFVDMLNHPRTDVNIGWLLVAVEHDLDQSGALSTSAGGAPTYANRFDVIPRDVPFRPARRTPRPIVRGPQTAIVTGPEGEEIHTDSLGRIKVCFHWNRYGQRDGTDSCWVRVAQSWAGGGWGAQFVPRIGHEVVVDFLEGDPDRPLVTGSVYNGRNAIPYDTPTQSGIKTRSSKQGTADNGNEIRFEDQKDAEELFVQAERNLTINVKKASSQSVGTDASTSVSGNSSTSVSGDESTSVDGNQTLSVGADRTAEIGANAELTVGADQTVSVGANRSITVGGDATLSVSGNLSISATEITLTGSSKVRLEVGGSYVEVTSGGVTVHGPSAKLEGVADAEVTAPAAKVSGTGTAELTGAQVTVNGSAAVTVQGATVNIN